MSSISRLGELTDDWRYLIRHQGWSAALPQVGQELATLPYRHLTFHVLARSLEEPLPALTPKIELEIREFEAGDVALVRQIDRPSQANLCAQRLARGHKGLFATHRGQPAGYAWGCTEFDPNLERVHLNLKPDDMLCVDVYTAPAFRNRGIQTTMVTARFQLFQELGYKRAIAYIETGNKPSLAVWRKFDSQVVGTIDFLRLGPWRWVRYELEAF